MASATRKASAMGVLLVLLLGVTVGGTAKEATAAAAGKLPPIMRRPSGGANGMGRFSVDEPVYRYRHMPGVAIPASRLMKLETYEGKPEYDP